MEFSQDFVAIQGLLTDLHGTLGDFTSVRHIGGNEAKISKIVEDLRHLLSRRKYVREETINTKHEMKLRKLILFFILNTDLRNKSTALHKNYAHLLDAVPQLSKCLLINIILKLDLYSFYAEAIYSLPIEISLELLEECSKCIKKSDPYKILEQTSGIARAIYYKIYHIRYETNNNKIDLNIFKLTERFAEMLKNYINPVTELILTWSKMKMYQYMGIAIFEMLTLLNNCLSLFKTENFIAPNYNFYLFTSETKAVSSQGALDKSVEFLNECNKTLMAICEANVVAVTIEVFCYWVECKYKNISLQQAVGEVAYQSGEILKTFEDTGELPAMVAAISIKPKTIDEIIEAADDEQLVENVTVKSDHQTLWFKAFLHRGILKSERIFDTLKSMIHLCDAEDLLYLLCLNVPEVKHEFDVKKVLLEYISKMPENESIQVISQYFEKLGLNNSYETENFNQQLTELFNKLGCDDVKEIPLKEISNLILQNPTKFILSLLDESLKASDRLLTIIDIYKHINLLCNMKSVTDAENSLLFEIIINKLKNSNLEENTETCMIQLMDQLVKCQLINEKILEYLISIVEDSLEKYELKKAVFICQICKALPNSLLPTSNYAQTILKLVIIANKNRWNFVTYSQEKCDLVSEIISIMYHYKDNIKNVSLDEILKLKEDLNNLENKINLYHILSDKEKETNNFLSYTNVGYDKNSNHNEQVCRLLKLLSCCVPLEWELVVKCLISDNSDPGKILQLYTDAILILTEISKKQCHNHSSLSYCFQQFCVIAKGNIYPLMKDNIDLEKIFIKNVCRLIKYLPDDINNSVEIPLVNMFNSDTLKLLKDDEDFVYYLVSLSHLNISKVICNKMI